MKNNKKLKIILSWLIVLTWMGFIFYLSSMTTTESNSKSKGTINKIIETTVETTNNIGITDKHPSAKKKQSVTDFLNKPLRKCAHASVYFVLSILILHALLVSHYKFRKKYLLTTILTVLLCFFYAITDEYHQTFVIGRTGQFSDVLIDTAGSVLGVMIYSIWINIKKKKTLDYPLDK